MTLVVLKLHMLALLLVLCWSGALCRRLALLFHILNGCLALLDIVCYCLTLVNILHRRLTLLTLIKLIRSLMFTLLFSCFPLLSSLNFIKTFLGTVSLVFRLRWTHLCLRDQVSVLLISKLTNIRRFKQVIAQLAHWLIIQIVLALVLVLILIVMDDCWVLHLLSILIATLTLRILLSILLSTLPVRRLIISRRLITLIKSASIVPKLLVLRLCNLFFSLRDFCGFRLGSINLYFDILMRIVSLSPILLNLVLDSTLDILQVRWLLRYWMLSPCIIWSLAFLLHEVINLCMLSCFFYRRMLYQIVAALFNHWLISIAAGITVLFVAELPRRVLVEDLWRYIGVFL